MKTHLFKLECLTDMHVGNGEANYSIIDKEVQKDTVLTDVPIIHSSGVKGALRKHFTQFWKGTDKEDNIRKIFGSDKSNSKNFKEGEYKFFSAICIARPLRVSCGNRPYILTTSDDVLQSFSALLLGLGLSDFYQYQNCCFDSGLYSTIANLEIEGKPSKELTKDRIEAIKKLIGADFAITKCLREYHLPIRARNVLDNGKSTNLWYEELVPHKSIFYFAVITPTDDCDLVFSSNPVQFGANASIGNGYTTIEEVNIG